ncbi:MAG: hypothetical protein QXG03_07050 [Halalkalicoccus sp.]
MLSDYAVTVLTKLLAVGLLAVTAVGTVVLLAEGDLRGAVPGLLGLYVGLILAAGVFTESLFEPRIQVAFAVGFVAWGGYVYLDRSALLGAVLVVTGAVWVIEQFRELAR